MLNLLIVGRIRVLRVDKTCLGDGVVFIEGYGEQTRGVLGVRCGSVFFL